MCEIFTEKPETPEPFSCEKRNNVWQVMIFCEEAMRPIPYLPFGNPLKGEALEMHGYKDRLNKKYNDKYKRNK